MICNRTVEISEQIRIDREETQGQPVTEKEGMSKENLDSLLDSTSFIRVGFAVVQRVQDANSWSQLQVSAWLFCGFTFPDPECVPRSSVRLMGQQLSIKTDNCQEVSQRRERKTHKRLSL